MNKRQKEVIQAQLTEEQKIIRQLEHHYQLALDDVELVIRLLQSDEQTQSKIHRINYQKKVKSQLEAILEKMRLAEYKTLQEYLTDCYTIGYVGTMYDIHGQGVPVIAPINQDAAAKAIQLDTQLSTRKAYKSANSEMVALYESLGIDTDSLKKTIRSEITRGISSGMTYDDIARNIASVSKAPLARAKTIARTEGHRIMQQSAEDARLEAKKQGADVVRQWDATLDGDTRSAHRELDGQIVELDEYFHYGTKKAKYPGGFGDPGLDCNCRCVALTRARRSLDENELDMLKKRAETFGLGKTEDFKDFEKKYMKAAQTVD
ncbi:MAG: phage minor head protein [Aristaeellaceae bacterium]